MNSAQFNVYLLPQPIDSAQQSLVEKLTAISFINRFR